MIERKYWEEVAGRAQAHATAQEARQTRGAEDEVAVSERRVRYEQESTRRTSSVLSEVMLTCQAISSIFNDAVSDARLRLKVLEESGKPPLLYSFTVRRGDDRHEVQVLLDGSDEICINSDLGFSQKSGNALRYHVNDRSQLNRDCGAQIYSAYEVGKLICEQLIQAPLMP